MSVSSARCFAGCLLLFVWLGGIEATASPSVPVGPMSASEVLELEAFSAHSGELEVSEQQLIALQAIDSPTLLKVFFGTWCHDSQREVPRLLELIDKTKTNSLTVSLYALDTGKSDPAGLAEQHQIRFTPTVVVLRNGHELGRIVERPEISLAADLLEILQADSLGESQAAGE